MRRGRPGDRDRSILFEPFALGPLTLPNRIVMAPMSRSASRNGVPDAAVAAYYARRARGGAGLILSESTSIGRPAAHNERDMPRFWGGDALAGWRQVLADVRQAGGRMGPQLTHVGGAAQPFIDWRPDEPFESPSGLLVSGAPGAREMTQADIDATVAAFAEAAGSAKAIGFDLIELHGAHGFLIDQFFQAQLNRRTDRYGGRSLMERTRFAVEVVKAVRQAVGRDFPILMRISQWKAQDYSYRIVDTPDELHAWLTPLADAGVDMFDCSQRRYWEPEFPDSPLNLAGWVKKLTGRPTIACGSVGLSGDFFSAMRERERSHPAPLEALLDRLERKEFDLVSVGRALLADADWPTKISEHRDQDLATFDPADLATLN